jgi:iron complex transport system permease protein
MRAPWLLALLLLLAVCSMPAGLSTGSVDTDWRDLLAALTGRSDGTAADVIRELRWPRSAAAFVTGALLACAGALMQVLLRNPLADPYVLGVSGGAATGALLAMLFGLPALGLHGAAFSGALLSMLLVFALAHGSGSWSSQRLLLTGVVVAAGWGAVIGFLLALSPEAGLRSMLFWLMGDLSYAGTPTAGAAVLLGGLLLAVALGRPLNILTRGARTAAALGVSVPALRRLVYILASLLTATAVTLAGNIGFVGLIVPHMLRLLGLRDHRLLLPAAALLGGSLLVIADTLARTALVGVPLFLVLLRHGREQNAAED